MLWRLEISNAAATDHALAFAGAAPAERMSSAACATTDHLPREDALTILEETCSGERPRAWGSGLGAGRWGGQRRLGEVAMAQARPGGPVGRQALRPAAACSRHIPAGG